MYLNIPKLTKSQLHSVNVVVSQRLRGAVLARSAKSVLGLFLSLIHTRSIFFFVFVFKRTVTKDGGLASYKEDKGSSDSAEINALGLAA